MIHGWALALAAGTMLLTLVLYGLQRSLVLTTRGPRIAGGARTHLLLLGALLLVLKAIGFWLDRYEVVFSERGIIFGAAYTDVFATLPALGGLAMLSVLAAAACVAQIGRPGLYLVGYGLALLVFAWVVGPRRLPGAAPALPRVRPTSWPPSGPSSQHNIRFTRAAYGLDRIQEKEFPADDTLDARALDAQRDDDQEHPPVGLPAAAANVRPAPGDPDLLQVRRRGQRPLPDQRRVPPAHAVAARALVSASAGWAELDQRAPDLHPRLRRGGGPGHPDHPRGAARVLRQGHPAAVRRAASRRSRGRRSTSARSPTSTSWSAPARRSSTIRAGTRTSTRATPGAGACRSRRGCGGWPSRPASASSRSSCPTTSRPRAGS